MYSQTKIAIPIFQSKIDEVIEVANDCINKGADILEFRIDALENPDFKQIKQTKAINDLVNITIENLTADTFVSLTAKNDVLLNSIVTAGTSIDVKSTAGQITQDISLILKTQFVMF